MRGGLLYRLLLGMLTLLRRLGRPAAVARLAPREADGYAVAVSYMFRARAWTFFHGVAGWARIQEAWARAEASTEARDAVAGTLSAEDRMRLVASGAEGVAVRAALYEGARESIDIATYYLQSDETGRSTVRALAACAQRGVRVRLLVDRYQTTRKRAEVEGMAELDADMRTAGIEVREWHDPDRPYDSNHRKMIVADGTRALVGGRNFADHYRGEEWRDVDLVIEGPSVAPLARIFARLWEGGTETGQTKPWVEAIPERVLDDPIMTFAISAVGAAARTIDLELAYFCAHDSLCGALERAARRGVRVRLLTNSAQTNDLPFANWTLYEGMRRVLEAGGAVHARRGAGRTLHPKYLVVDGEWLSFGSHNLDYYSPRHCGEVNLVVRDARLGAMLGEFFETGLADATPVALETEVKPFLASHGASRLFDRAFRDFQ